MGKKADRTIPVIDLFAGPGGLAEGFSSVRTAGSKNPFDVVLSIEKEKFAHETLELRTFFRMFPLGKVPDDYYKFLRKETTREELFEKFPKQAALARARALHVELGSEKSGRKKILKKIPAEAKDASNLVLIGGPPCQAYSIVGRARNMGNKGYIAEKDKRQTLYIEYLQFVADLAPAVFLMENVKGLLSATLKEQNIFERIVADLEAPQKALAREGRSHTKRGRAKLGYKIFSISPSGTKRENRKKIDSYIVRSEKHGVPQTRHRLFILGVRNDLGVTKIPTLATFGSATVRDVIMDFPRLRSMLSREDDSDQAWKAAVEKQTARKWVSEVCDAFPSVGNKIKKYSKSVDLPGDGIGGQFVQGTPNPRLLRKWFSDSKLQGFSNHEARAHMASDLSRYLFLSTYAQLKKKSPKLEKFPRSLLPAHVSASKKTIEERLYFNDRFRVQVWDKPATTITSHIAKDGHYFVHPDPRQYRTLTVREAARVQTFPDNYFFCGPRTSQYQQVGNAVPPYLASQIGKIVFKILVEAGLA